MFADFKKGITFAVALSETFIKLLQILAYQPITKS